MVLRLWLDLNRVRKRDGAAELNALVSHLRSHEQRASFGHLFAVKVPRHGYSDLAGMLRETLQHGWQAAHDDAFGAGEG